MTHSWARPGYQSATGLREQALPWLCAKAKFRRGELLALSNLDELPPEAVEEARGV